MTQGKYCLLYFYVPESHKEIVKNELFSVGAGAFKNYDCCSFEVLGYGQYRPLKNSTPYFGTKDKIEYIPEYRVEMMIKKESFKKIVEVLKSIHPYEEVAYGALDILLE